MISDAKVGSKCAGLLRTRKKVLGIIIFFRFCLEQVFFLFLSRLGGMNARPIQNVTSSINMLQKDATSSYRGIFTIQGTRVLDDAKHLSQLPKGLYIVNGRKMAIR